MTDFDIVDCELAPLQEDGVLVRSMFASVDPYQRNRMRSNLRPGDLIPARCIGKVITSNSSQYARDEVVFVGAGSWSEYLVCRANNLTALDPDLSPPEIHLGIAGVPGLTAYVGLLHHGAPATGETVFVSGASGAVGSLACQIARLKGCKVVGSAGSAEKIKWLLQEARVDAAINYKEPDFAARLQEHCQGGIDLVFENVGGSQLDAVIEAMRPHGRVVLCGLIESINSQGPRGGLADLDAFIRKRLALKGFTVNDHLDCMPAFHKDLKRWLASGEVAWRQTVVAGLENAPAALIRLLTGEKEGKMLVRISPASAA